MSDHDDPFANDDLASWVGDVVEESWDDADVAVDLDPDGGGDLGGIPLEIGLDDDAHTGIDLQPDPDALGIGLDDSGDGDGDGGPLDDPAPPTISLDDADDARAAPDSEGAFDLQTVVGLASEWNGVVPDAAAVEAILDRLDLPDAYLGVAGRGAALVLQELGVDAHVAHGTFEQLADQLEAGHHVSVTGADGGRVPVIEVDFAQGDLVIEDGTGQRRIALDDFAETWSASSFEMVVAGGDVVLPVTIERGGR